jgi:hypothetical protein
MSKHKLSSPACPILDLLTDEDIHRSLLRTTLARKGVQDPDGFLEGNSLESQVMYRDVRMDNGTTKMMASVVITKVTPKVQAVPTDSQPKVE